MTKLPNYRRLLEVALRNIDEQPALYTPTQIRRVKLLQTHSLREVAQLEGVSETTIRTSVGRAAQRPEDRQRIRVVVAEKLNRFGNAFTEKQLRRARMYADGYSVDEIAHSEGVAPGVVRKSINKVRYAKG